ncbi:Pycsar system effector family protein [Reichenbachiella sp. MSK19-1]|uniref:Pycsar system effector family protein n=1 Tax=Reichenbachiella sp. MSK19-1 TaxID=1897631 RepID=UPI000E6D24DD|nr:Pycsar system effector family protein [Reichenbachiella sp. MSK19-1]RJE70382.1 hypothetical protein BGP76_09820 [Reichenbachiella sp. MSK19-1]
MSSEIIENSKGYVQSIYEKCEEKSLYYHNWEHTLEVYKAALEIANHTDGVTNEDKELLSIAVLFHDIAYTMGSQDHERESAEIAAKFLTDQAYDEDKITIIQQLIMATKLGHTPSTVLEGVIQDADLSHLGNPDYLTTSYGKLYDEIKAKIQADITQHQWMGMCSVFLRKHQYNTAYAKANYRPVKKENIIKIDQAKKELESMKAPIENELDKGKRSNKKGGKKSKNDLPEKGIETMFRTALRNHMSLSQIADNKANTLISVNGIIISIALSILFPKLDNNAYLIYPGLSLSIFSITTIILSILSTIPKTTNGSLSKKEVDEKKGNLIFFGNFHKMSLEDYEWSIGELMKDKDYLYKSLTRDLYFLGKVLNRKYQLLRWSYYVFVSGLIITMLLFAVHTRSILE